MSDEVTPDNAAQIRRYAPGWQENSDLIYMHEISNGDFVRYSDHAATVAALEAEVASLRAAAEAVVLAFEALGQSHGKGRMVRSRSDSRITASR